MYDLYFQIVRWFFFGGKLPGFSLGQKPFFDENTGNTSVALTYTERNKGLFQGRKMLFSEKKRKWTGIFFMLCFLAAAGMSAWILKQYAREGERREESEKVDKKEKMGNAPQKEEIQIRVQICSSNYEEKLHQTAAFRCTAGFTVQGPDWKEEVASQDIWETDLQEFLQLREQYTGTEAYQIKIVPNNGEGIELPGLVRASGTPLYQGSFILEGTEEGMLLINELPLEEYLGAVVSSEMPSYYPFEAQMAQAVCARTYALNCIKNRKRGETGADLDDSVSFQVYNNYQETESSRRAVEATKGEVMDAEEVWYYSTSCGTSGREDLADNEAFQNYLSQEPPETAEYGSPWVRWETELPAGQILNHVNQTYEASWQALLGVQIQERKPDGQVQTLLLQGDQGEVSVKGEYALREILGVEGVSIVLRDGSVSDNMTLLPSAYFYLEEIPDEEETEEEKNSSSTELGGLKSVRLFGGGYGHGIGMSQCGAAQMAQEGADYQEILLFYYQESGKIHEVGEESSSAG